MNLRTRFDQVRTTRRLYGWRFVFALARFARRKRPLEFFERLAPLIRGQKGIEIGGPTQLFARSGPLPFYPIVGSLDNCNFAPETFWEGSIREGMTFRFDESRPPGRQFILDTVDLHPIADNAYRFLLSSHVLEHIANPLRALAEWRRILDQNGVLVVVLPHKEASFDHRRPLTTLAHLESDFALNVGEDDPTHVSEVLELTDLARGGFERDPWKRLVRDFAHTRFVHHHVFDTELAVRTLDRAGFELLDVEPFLPFNIALAARVPRDGTPWDNSAFLSHDAPWRTRSPFRLDRQRRVAQLDRAQ